MDIWIPISFSCLSLVVLLSILRRNRYSLGLPFAYMFSLLLQHVPGAYAHAVRPDMFSTTEAVTIGMWQTSVACAFFVIGVSLGGRRSVIEAPRGKRVSEDPRFLRFCLFGGWFFVYGLSPLSKIPSLGAVIEKGGAIWLLGAMLGLREAVRHLRFKDIIIWLAALSVYPVLMLLLGGFLSYGAGAAVIALSALAVSHYDYRKVTFGLALCIWVGLTVFVNYYVVRGELRSVIWSDADLEHRINAVWNAFSKIDILDLYNDEHAIALDERLNQNYFVGLSAQRLEDKEVDFVSGRSFYEGLIAMVPRAIWSDKPVFGGSGTIVRDMTGLDLNVETTSWGVGQVMEFYMNYGWTSLLGGFFFLGWLMRRLDFQASLADQRGDPNTLILCFLPAAALNQPLGSLVELCGGAISAFVAALCWRAAWRAYTN